MDFERSTATAQQVDEITVIRNGIEIGSGEKKTGAKGRPNLHQEHISRGFQTRARQSGAYRD